MRALIVILFALLLAVNAQFAFEIGKPGLRVQMFGKDLIRMGDKKKKKHVKKSPKKVPEEPKVPEVKE